MGGGVCKVEGERAGGGVNSVCTEELRFVLGCERVGCACLRLRDCIGTDGNKH